MVVLSRKRLFKLFVVLNNMSERRANYWKSMFFYCMQPEQMQVFKVI